WKLADPCWFADDCGDRRGGGWRHHENRAKPRMTEAARKINLSPSIPFIDLQAQRRRIATRIDQAIAAVLAHGQFIMGPEIAQLEARLAAHCGIRHAIGCGSGAEALLLALMALDARPG